MSCVRTAGINVLALTLILLALSSNIQPCVSDTVVLRNKLNNGILNVACHAYVDWRKYYDVKAGEEMTLQVPFNGKVFGMMMPSFCTGWWVKRGESQSDSRVRLYRSYYNHEACKGKCTVEVNSTGSFIWNRTEKAWDLIEKFN